MKKSILLILLTVWFYQVRSQDVYKHQFSSTPDISRYEIVQSEMGVRYTFKIDKYRGEVFQLVKGLNDKLTWESLGIDPIVDLYLETVLGLIAGLTQEQISELKALTPEQFAELTPDQMAKFGLKDDQVSALTPDKVNFQIFISGLGIRYTFLLHIHTGKTWQLTKDTETDKLLWSSMN